MSRIEFKPLLFDTALRNPSRMKGFLAVLKKYEGKVPNNDVINCIVKDIIGAKIYYSKYQMSIPLYKDIFNDDTKTYTDKQLQDIVDNTRQDHQEGGYDWGWPSRFFTWYKLQIQLGFVYFSPNDPIVITKAGNHLIQSLKDNDDKLENAVMLNAFAHLRRNNPFVSVANDNGPLPFLIAILLKLKEISNNSTAGLYKFEIPYLLCWKDSNVDEICKYILDKRKLLGLTPSDECVYENALEILGADDSQRNRFKQNTITVELVDEYIRKMRLTGMITLRGFGKYIDIDTEQIGKAKYLVQHYLECNTFKTEKEYFDYASQWDDYLCKYEADAKISEDETLSKFMNQVNSFSLETIQNEFYLLSTKGSSKHPILKYIPDYQRLEFLVALLLKKTYPDLYVKPNYSMDDEGLPKSTAGGNQCDIIVKEDDVNINVEVTMLQSTKQNIMETSPVISHLQDTIETNKKSFSIFIAPTIHKQTEIFMKLASSPETYGVDIETFSIKDFLNLTKSKMPLKDLAQLDFSL